MAKLKKILGRFAADLESQFEARRLAQRQLHADAPVYIQPYRSFGTRVELLVRARVLQQEPLSKVTGGESVWSNLVRSARQFGTNEIGGAVVRITVGDISLEATADDEGYISAPIAAPPEIPESGWIDARLELLKPQLRGREITATAHVLVPPDNAEFGVISDLDDTVIQTNVTDRVKMLKTVLLGNSRTRIPFEGVSGFYAALRAGSNGQHANPIFYLSGGPWNLYELYHDFLEIQNVPAGPILLADFGVDKNVFIHPEHQDHKSKYIRDIIEMYPAIRFILIGDSGEHDPEIYADAARSHPGRVAAIYIRDLGREADVKRLAKLAADSAAGDAPFVAVKTAVEATNDARKRGFVS